MAQRILWNNRGHVKWGSNNPKMKLDWARSQPQKQGGYSQGVTQEGNTFIKTKELG
jgi:hypothetical protein